MATETLTATNSDGYPTLAGVTADPVVLTVTGGALSVLLVRRVEPPFRGRWALPGGFVDLTGEAEHPAQTVARKLAEKTGLASPYTEQIGVFADPGRDPRGLLWSVSYLALVPASELPQGSDAEWHPVAELPALAFDHADILEAALDMARGRLWLSNLAVGLLPEEFTLAEARAVFDAIGGRAHDQRNFGRDLKVTGLVEPSGGVRSGGAGRPATLWRFRDRHPTWGRAYGRRTAA